VPVISVIIPSYNSETTIEKCLDSLQNQSYQDKYEIILVDSSQDRTAKTVSEYFPNVKLIHLDEKTDPGSARNIGIREARGDLIAFIDSDCVAGQDWLERIAVAHQSSYKVVGGSVSQHSDRDGLAARAGYISEFREFIPQRPKGEVTHIAACNISYKRRTFDEYGLFNREYYPQEDLIYNTNLVTGGEKILFDPEIGVHHHTRSTMKDFLQHQKMIGMITARVLKVAPLEGSSIVRRPTLALFLLPVLPLVKFFRTLRVFLKFQPETIVKHPLVLPVFAVGLIFWAFGFARGIYGANEVKDKTRIEHSA